MGHDHKINPFRILSTAMSSVGRSCFAGSLIGALVGSGTFGPVAFAQSNSKSFAISYSGRLANAVGEGIRGPVDLEIVFYREASGGTPVGVSKIKRTGLALVDGVFQVDLAELSPNELNLLLAADRSTWVEVIDRTNNTTYPRQVFAAVPFALKVPVDGASLSYSDLGELKVKSIGISQVTGLEAALTSKRDSVESVSIAGVSGLSAELAGKASSSHFHDLTAITGLASSLATKASTTTALAGDLGGTLAAPQVLKIQGTTVVAPSGGDSGKYMKYNGSQFVLDNPAGGGGTVTTVTAALPLSVTTGTTTPALSIPQATTGADGYLRATDFTLFNNKQDAITGTSVLTTGTLTSTMQNGLQLKPFNTAVGNTGELRFRELLANGSNFVGFKAADNLAADQIWTLPAADGGSGQVLSTNGVGILSWMTPSGGGTVTSVGLTQPTEGITVSGPVTGSGSITLSLANDLAAVEGLNTIGGVERTGANTWSTYTLSAAGKALIDDADATTQRTTLGLGTLATAAAVSGGTGGTITDADINSAAAIAQSKISGLTTDLAAKEPTVTTGTSAQFYRGDKSWQTLDTTNVPEGTNLYYTDARARTAAVADVINDATTNMAPSQNAVFDALALKQNAITTATTVNAGTVTTALQNGVQIKPYGVAAGNSGELRFDELAANGTNYVGFKAPDNISTNRVWTLPSMDGTNGNVLSTNGTGTLSWVTGTPIVNLTSGVTGALMVTNGGTGISSGTSGGILYYSSASGLASSALLTSKGIMLGGGAGSAPTTTAALTNGQLLIGSTSLAPVPATLTSGGNIQITSGAGSITLDTIPAPIFNNLILDGPGGLTLTDATAKLGIGTGVPGAMLHIKSASGPTDIILEASGYQGRIYTNGSGDLNLESPSTKKMDFKTNGASRLLIDSNGYVGIGITTPSYNLHVVGNAGLSTGTSWTNASDRRLKDIEGDYEYGLEEIKKLHTVRYRYKKENALSLPSDHKMTGFIAQEVREVIPDAVVERTDGYLELNVDPIHWATVNAVQELAAENESLRTENREMKAKLNMVIESLCEKDPHGAFCP